MPHAVSVGACGKGSGRCPAPERLSGQGKDGQQSARLLRRKSGRCGNAPRGDQPADQKRRR